MKTRNGAETLKLAQDIVKLRYTDEYQQQYRPDGVSILYPNGVENWIKLDRLKVLLGINHPLVSVYMRQIESYQFGEPEEDYGGVMQFRFSVPNNYGTYDTQQYGLAELLAAYGDLRGAIWELYQIATQLWEPDHDDWEDIRDWDWGQLQCVPSPKLAASLDKDHVTLMDYLIFNMLGRHYDAEGYNRWIFLLYGGEAYIGMANYWITTIVPLEEFLMSPLDYQVIGTIPHKWSHTTQGITLRGVLNKAKLMDWRTK